VLVAPPEPLDPVLSDGTTCSASLSYSFRQNPFYFVLITGVTLNIFHGAWFLRFAVRMNAENYIERKT
jgi:hypothetical protein